MVQAARDIDIRRTYIPIDPNAFPTILQTTARTNGAADPDAASGRIPIMPYDGYNFLPTPQGYSSFFGVNTNIDVNALAGNVDEVFVAQKTTLENFAIALKDDGIWTKDLGSSGAWTQAITLAVPGTYRPWSKCIIDQELYLYRSFEATFWKWGPSTSYAFTAIAPSFLTMAQQVGIFKAGGRLGFWDTANSTGWSAFEDTADFTPSTETLAGNAIFQDIVGKIVTVLQHGNGFIIYCTKSIVGVRRNTDSPFLFEGKAIFNNNGISFRNEAAYADPDTSHFAMTTTGLCEITPDRTAEFVANEISRYLKERKEPMMLQLVNGKYLFFRFLAGEYNTGRVTFSVIKNEPPLVDWADAKAALLDAEADPDRALRHANWRREQIYLNTAYSYTSYAAASGVGVVPVWRNYLHTTVQAALVTSFKTAYDAGTAGTFFTPTTSGGVLFDILGNPVNVNLTQITGASVPTPAGLKAGFVNAIHQIQDLAQEELYSKQEWIWDLEDKMWLELKARLQNMNGEPKSYTSRYFSWEGSTRYTEPQVTEYDAPQTIVNFSRSSESNKYYGSATKSLWAQRAITRTLTWKVKRYRAYEYEVEEASWIGSSPFTTSWNTYAPIVSSYAALYTDEFKAELLTALQTAIGGSWTWVEVDPSETPADGTSYGGRYRSVQFTWLRYNGIGTLMETHYINYQPNGIGVLYPGQTDGVILPAGYPVFVTNQFVTERFDIEFIEGDLPAGPYKVLGYSQIVGHGHYTGGLLIVDNMTPETTDYVDYYLTPPAQSNRSLFNGYELLADPWDADCGFFTERDADTLINAVVYEGACEGASEAIPVGNILWQAGSTEPIYPSYIGAFVMDTHLKKWGKMKLDFKNLFDAYPVNTMAGEGIFPYEHFLPKLACRLDDGTFPVFDEYPADSEICYGKAGYYRRGFTDLEEVIFHNRAFRTGTLRIEGSEDGQSIDPNFVIERTYTNSVQAREGFTISARWFNIVFKGHFDLTHLALITSNGGKR